MTTRPQFLDGAILAAADLSALEGTGRDRDARHARHLHTPGIAAGLELQAEPRNTAGGQPYVDVSLTAGYAIDGTGRELVLGADQPLSPDRFLGDNPNPRVAPGETVSVWHPVFLRGLDSPIAGARGSSRCSGGAGTSGVDEIVEVEFGRPGDTDADQPVPGPAEGPGDGTWRVLIGFVRFDTAIGRFSAVGTSADGVSVTRAGARAGLVASPGGRVEIRAGATPVAGTPALVLGSQPDASLTFGTHDGSGALAALLSVDSAGNVTAKGTLSGVQTAGSVRLVAGTAFDGTVLPLPAGVDQATIDSGGLEVSILVTPRLPDPAAAPNPGQMFLPVRCDVDTDRRVACQGTWFRPGVGGGDGEAAACDFLVVVSVPGDGGAP
jgi:hypothetical protein